MLSGLSEGVTDATSGFLLPSFLQSTVVNPAARQSCSGVRFPSSRWSPLWIVSRMLSGSNPSSIYSCNSGTDGKIIRPRRCSVAPSVSSIYPARFDSNTLAVAMHFSGNNTELEEWKLLEDRLQSYHTTVQETCLHAAKTQCCLLPGAPLLRFRVPMVLLNI